MSKANKNDLFGGSLWSKVLFILSFILLFLTVITLMSKIETYDPVSREIVSSKTPWKIAILLFIISFVTGYIAYRFAGGRKNSAIYEGKNCKDANQKTQEKGTTNPPVGFS